MKKLTLCLMATSLSLSFIPLQSSAKTLPNTTIESKPIEAAEAKILLQRLQEIDTMDKSNLTRSDKKELRTEVRSIQKKLNGGGGVYISVGAIILIILLLIIIF
jgi:hypothetical protein